MQIPSNDLIDPQVIWDQLGIFDYNSNATYRESLTKRIITQEDVDLLDPDKIDLEKFWGNVSRLDDSSIAGAGNTNADVRHINNMNRRIIDMSGVMGWLRLTPATSILEIGPGFGSFYELLPHYINYVGFDIIPRFSRAVHAIYGLKPDYVKNMEDYFEYVVTFNVFQHLSHTVRCNYIKQALTLLAPNGLFIFNTGCFSEALEKNFVDESGNSYIYTAGQLMLNRSANYYFDLINTCAHELDIKIYYSGHQTYPGIVTYIFRKVK